MVPGTAERVPLHTGERDNRRIAAALDASVRWHAEHPRANRRRLRDLDAEWDTERTLEANAATLALAGTGALELDEAVKQLEQFASGAGAPQYVEPDISATGWVLELRARFEDARHRLA